VIFPVFCNVVALRVAVGDFVDLVVVLVLTGFTRSAWWSPCCAWLPDAFRS